MTTPVGIDLGTTNSAAAYVDRTGNSAMIMNEVGDLLTPSVVLFEDDEFVVGKEAKLASTTNPERIAEWVKRDMGLPSYHRSIRGEKFPPEVIQACILHKLERSISSAISGEYQVVITVPAYFDETRRSATSTAAEMANLDLLDIVNEPTAAAMAFGETLGYLNATGDVRKDLTVLVYDLGGGTFDVTLLRLAPRDIRMLATDGDVMLGGHDWDMRLVEHLAEKFELEYRVDLRADPIGFYRLYNAAVEAKHTLSARQKAAIRVAHGAHVLETEITRGQFELMTADLMERTSHTVRNVLRAAEMEMDQVDRVLLVGGSTRMPAVAKMLERLGADTPARNVHPDEAVARGAALYARFLLESRRGEKAAKPMAVTNVNSHTLGLEGIDLETRRKVVRPVIEKNTPLPIRKTKKFCTKEDDQRSIVINVLEGESRSPEDCASVGRAVVRKLPRGLKKGHPIRVTFSYATNGRLDVHAEIEDVDHKIDFSLERTKGIDVGKIQRWREIVVGDRGFADFELAADIEVKDAEDNLPGVEKDSDEDDSWVDPDDIFAMAMAEEKETKPRPQQRRQPQLQQQPKPQPTFEPDPEPEPTRTAAQTAPRPVNPTQTSNNGSSRAIVYVVGLLVFSVGGLGLGFLLVNWLFPMLGLPLPW